MGRKTIAVGMTRRRIRLVSIRLNGEFTYRKRQGNAQVIQYRASGNRFKYNFINETNRNFEQ